MIKIFDNELKYLGPLDSYESFQCSAKYADIGKFSIKTKISPKVMKMLKPGYTVQYGDFAGRIETIQIQNGEDAIITGYDLLSLLDMRLIWGDYFYKGKVEDFLRKIVNENAISPADGRRKIPFLKLGNSSNLLATTERNTAHESLLKACKEVCAAADYGFRIVFNPVAKEGLFEIYEGHNRVVGQPQQVIIGREYDNVLQSDYTQSVQKEKTTCLVVADEKTLAIGDEATGLDRKEIFLKSSKRQDKLTTAEFEAILKTDGNAKLMKPVECYDADIANVSLSLGDKVSVYDRDFGINYAARVSEKQITIQNGDKVITYLLGDDITVRGKE